MFDVAVLNATFIWIFAPIVEFPLTAKLRTARTM